MSLRLLFLCRGLYVLRTCPQAERAPKAKKYVFLLPLLLAVRLSGYSGDRSGKFARTRKKDGVV
jgi:hypothetical protein